MFRRKSGLKSIISQLESIVQSIAGNHKEKVRFIMLSTLNKLIKKPKILLKSDKNTLKKSLLDP